MPKIPPSCRFAVKKTAFYTALKPVCQLYMPDVVGPENAVAARFEPCYTLGNGMFPAILISFKLFLFDDKEKKVLWRV